MKTSASVIRHKETGLFMELRERHTHTGRHVDITWANNLDRATLGHWGSWHWASKIPTSLSMDDVEVVDIERITCTATKIVVPPQVESEGIIIPNPEKEKNSTPFDLLFYLDRLLNGCTHVGCTISGSKSGTLGICSCDVGRYKKKVIELLEKL